MGHVEYLLPDYLNNRLEESLKPGVESHLEECESCRDSLEGLREGFEALRTQHIPHPSETYFSTILPRVRQRLEKKEARPFFAHPLVTRIAMPIAAGALALLLLLRLPLSTHNADAERNPLQPVLQGIASDELVDIVLDQIHLQALNTVGEGETSSLLAVPLLGGDQLLADAEHLTSIEAPILGGRVPESLDQLSDSEIDALVARLGERTMI
jgi:hypothetical protein